MTVPDLATRARQRHELIEKEIEREAVSRAWATDFELAVAGAAEVLELDPDDVCRFFELKESTGLSSPGLWGNSRWGFVYDDLGFEVHVWPATEEVRVFVAVEQVTLQKWPSFLPNVKLVRYEWKRIQTLADLGAEL